MEQSRKEKEVWEACEVLMSQEEKLTYKAIGDKLVEMGFCRGSNSDICRYLGTWRQHKGYAQTDTPRAASSEQSATSLFPPSQKDLWPVLEQIQHHLRQLDDKVERLSKQRADAQSKAASKHNDHLQQDWLSETFSTNQDGMSKVQFEQFTNSQAKAFLRLFEHHEMLFEKYLSSLDALRQTNARLIKRIAHLESIEEKNIESFVEIDD